MPTVTVFMAIASLVVAILSGAKPDWVPMWVAVVLTAITLCLMVLPK